MPKKYSFNILEGKLLDVFSESSEVVEESIQSGWRLHPEFGQRIQTARFEGKTDEEKGKAFDQFLREMMEGGNFPAEWGVVEKLGVISGIFFGRRNNDGTLKEQ